MDFMRIAALLAVSLILMAAMMAKPGYRGSKGFILVPTAVDREARFD